MAVEFKSHVLRRDEKGMFGIPFKRLLGSGVAAVVVFMLAKFASPILAFPIGILSFFIFLILTSQRGGLSLYVRLNYQLRGWIIINAAANPDGLFAQIANMLELPTHLVLLNGDQVYAPHEQAAEGDLTMWVTFASTTQKDGLELVDKAIEVEPIKITPVTKAKSLLAGAKANVQVNGAGAD